MRNHKYQKAKFGTLIPRPIIRAYYIYYWFCLSWIQWIKNVQNWKDIHLYRVVQIKVYYRAIA